MNRCTSSWIRSELRGKPYFVCMTAAQNKFLRIYYARVKECLNAADSKATSQLYLASQNYILWSAKISILQAWFVVPFLAPQISLYFSILGVDFCLQGS